MPHTTYVIEAELAEMKPARDDDDTTGSAMVTGDVVGDEDEKEEEEEEQDQQQREIKCNLLLSLSSCWSSSPSCSIQNATQQASAGTAAAPPPINNNISHRRRRRCLNAGVFECRTCGREFATFQALGGHRTSHLRRPAAMTKTKKKQAVLQVHACAMCGLGFPTGQALGGHMRRHRMGRAECMGFASGDLDLTQIIVHGRPSCNSSSSVQLLNLFV